MRTEIRRFSTFSMSGGGIFGFTSNFKSYEMVQVDAQLIAWLREGGFSYVPCIF